MLPVFIMAAGAGAKTVYDMFQSDQLNERAMKKSVKAMNCMAEAAAERREVEEKTKNSLVRLANRKKAILNTSMQTFLEVYTKIKKVNFTESDAIKELDSLTPALIQETVYSVAIAQQPMSEAESITSFAAIGMGTMVAGTLAGNVALTTSVATIGGNILSGLTTVGGGAAASLTATAIISDSIKKDAEKNLKSANLRVKQAEMIELQNQTVSLSYSALDERASLITETMTKLNILFMRNLEEVSEIIDKNGTDKKCYSAYERKVLGVCANLAVAIKALLDTPLVDANGEIAQSSKTAIDEGNQCIDVVNQMLI